MNERSKELIMNLVELMRSCQQRVYDYEFADYLMCNTGIKPEELVECGIYGSRPLHPDVGGIVQREDGTILHVFREHYGEGDIFKSWRRFYLGALDEVCYVPEGSDSGYSRQNFLDLCDGNAQMAEQIFEAVTWEHPESWDGTTHVIDQTFVSGERVSCNECGKINEGRRYDMTRQVKDLQVKESIMVAGISWSKFTEDNEGNAYMLADKKICAMEFGENNDWKESPIRRYLNDELYQKVVEELGSDVLVTIQTDLFSHDGLRDYGKCEDMVSLLTYDLYRNNRENIKGNDEPFFTCTPDSTQSGASSRSVQCVFPDYIVCWGRCDYVWGVRPFIILKSDTFVSTREQGRNQLNRHE